MKGYIIYNRDEGSNENGYIITEDGKLFRIWWFRANGGDKTLKNTIKLAKDAGVETFMSGKKIPFIETEIVSEEPEWVIKALAGLRR